VAVGQHVKGIDVGGDAHVRTVKDPGVDPRPRVQGHNVFVVDSAQRPSVALADSDSQTTSPDGTGVAVGVLVGVGVGPVVGVGVAVGVTPPSSQVSTLPITVARVAAALIPSKPKAK